MDSRIYLFIFPLNTPADVPADFRKSVQGYTFETGVFLPQDDTNWFTRPPEYPARLLLLDGRFLTIIPHPTSGQNTVGIKLDDLVQLEASNILLLGWIELTTRDSTHRLIYNTRASRPLEKFVETVRRRWLGESKLTQRLCSDAFGQELDVKFRNLLHFSLARNEIVRLQYFSGPTPHEDHFLIFRRIEYWPGNLVVLTSGNRLLWLTDSYRGRREAYAGIALDVPATLFLFSALEKASDHEDLIITFTPGNSWRVSLYGSDPARERFSQALNKVLTAAPRNQAVPQFNEATNDWQ